jgi:hypothetical protein
MVFCSRGVDGQEQFGVIERFNANSPYARKHGDSQEVMLGNNAFLVLQNYVESERSVLQLFRQDIAATVEEKLTESYPNLNTTRVTRAIAAWCDKKAPAQSEKEAPARSIKIRM